MNILIISDVLPYPLNTGGAQAQYNMIDYLRKLHHITFLFPENGHNKIRHLKHLKNVWPEVDFKPYRYVWQLTYPKFLRDKIVRALKLIFIPRNKHFLVERALKPYGTYFSNHFISFVNRTAQSCNADIIQVEFFPNLPIVKYISHHAKKIYIQHEIRYIRNERYLKDLSITQKEEELKRAIFHQEIADMNLYDTVVTLTPTDKSILIKDGVVTNVMVSPAAISTQITSYKEWDGKFVFIGAHHHLPNQEGIEWLTEAVSKHLKEKIHLNIIGTGWTNRYNNNMINVNIMGYVEHLEENINGSIMLVPILTGSGMRMKILEGAAMCMPIITTSVGVEGLNFKHGESCLIADSAEEFAKAIDRLRNDKNLRQTLAINAQQIYIQNYSISALGKIRNNTYIL